MAIWTARKLSIFRVKAPVARRPPHRPGREDFPHPVPRLPVISDDKPVRRHTDWRIAVATLMTILMSPTHFTADSVSWCAISKYLPTFFYSSRYTLFHLQYSGSLELSLPHLTGMR